MLSDEAPMEAQLVLTGVVVTFTAWMTDGPKMRGIVGGAVGEGEFVGRVLNLTPGAVTAIDAVYHVIGTRHALAALVHVEQAGLQATVTGVVTDGWGKGGLVNGAYAEVRCDRGGATTHCWRGTLTIGGPVGGID